MLNKKPGDYRIHRLWIVALQESDFNQANRIAIGRPIQHLLEQEGLAPDMQHGSTASKLCHSAVLNKQLTLEIHRYVKQPLAYIENDAVGCYDRIINPLVLIHLRILGLYSSTTASLAATWEQTFHRIKSLYGVSSESYTNHKDKLLYGPGQGSTIGPLLWLLCFILIFHSLSTTTPAIHLNSVNQSQPITYVGEAFVDDSGLGTNMTTNANLNELISNLNILAQSWEKLLYSTGSALNLSKSFWFLLSWNWAGGKAHLQNIASTPGDIKMTSEGALNTVITIPRIETTARFRTLGVYITPSGSNKAALQILREYALDNSTNITGSRITRQEALTSYIQYLLPKLRFQPPVLSISQQDCDKLMPIILAALLPKLHVNRNTTRSIIYGPEKYGGLALPNLYTTTSADKLRLFLGHLRLQDRTGQLIHIDLTYLQLLSGIGTFLLNQDAASFPWLETGWITSLWEFTSKHSLTFLYPKQWIPPQPREYDIFLMQAFASHKPPVPIMAALNRCRIFLQVITLSDICTADGKRILALVKRGVPITSRTSQLLWPAQGNPSRGDWGIWRKCLSFFETIGKLTQPLGSWCTPSHQKWNCFFHPPTGDVYNYTTFFAYAFISI
jgi:hypothetical protein